jgi:hypothetical protein
MIMLNQWGSGLVVRKRLNMWAPARMKKHMAVVLAVSKKAPTAL